MALVDGALAEFSVCEFRLHGCEELVVDDHVAEKAVEGFFFCEVHKGPAAEGLHLCFAGVVCEAELFDGNVEADKVHGGGRPLDLELAGPCFLWPVEEDAVCGADDVVKVGEDCVADGGEARGVVELGHGCEALEGEGCALGPDVCAEVVPAAVCEHAGEVESASGAAHACACVKEGEEGGCDECAFRVCGAGGALDRLPGRGEGRGELVDAREEGGLCGLRGFDGSVCVDAGDARVWGGGDGEEVDDDVCDKSNNLVVAGDGARGVSVPGVVHEGFDETEDALDDGEGGGKVYGAVGEVGKVKGGKGRLCLFRAGVGLFPAGLEKGHVGERRVGSAGCDGEARGEASEGVAKGGECGESGLEGGELGEHGGHKGRGEETCLCFLDGCVGEGLCGHRDEGLFRVVDHVYGAEVVCEEADKADAEGKEGGAELGSGHAREGEVVPAGLEEGVVVGEL